MLTLVCIVVVVVIMCVFMWATTRDPQWTWTQEQIDEYNRTGKTPYDE